MQEFSKIFEHKAALVGVDEIELGTDSDEAAARLWLRQRSLAARQRCHPSMVTLTAKIRTAFGHSGFVLL